MNYSYNHETALKELNSWAQEFGLSRDDLQTIQSVAQARSDGKTPVSPQAKGIADQLAQSDQEIKDLVENKIKAKGIPVEIYDNKKHNGLFKLK